MICKISRNKHRETCSSTDNRKTKFACIIEADESTRRRLEGSLPKVHEDRKFIPMPKALQISEAKAAVDKEWEKLEKLPAWQLTNVRTKKEVIDEARKEGRRQNSSLRFIDGHLSSQEFKVGTTITNIQRPSGTPR